MQNLLSTINWTTLRSIVCAIVILLTLSTQSAWSDETSSVTETDQPNKPNVIFIMADDLGYGGLGCYGQQLIKTPELDQMAAEGMRFTQAYAGATVCAPSRCVLMTGLHTGHARVRGNKPATGPAAALHTDDVTVAEILQDAGYTTGLIGKWGLGEAKNNQQGLPRRQGFDYFFGYLKQGHAHNYFTDYLWRNESKVPLANVISDDPKYRHNVASKKVEYSHDLFADDALKFIQEHRDEPFFLYLALTIPHANNEAGDQGMEVPDDGQYADKDWPEPQKGHAAMVSRMDHDIGRLLALLKELNLDERTLVIFTSDNGAPHSEGGFDPEFFDANGALQGYKGNLTEGGIRIPMIARWPGQISAGVTCDSPVYFPDVMPTLAAICGAQTPKDIDGVDFSPTLLGHDQPELSDRFFYWEWNQNVLRRQAARWRNWKAVYNPETDKLELFDLSNDIGETQDVSEQNPEIAVKLAEFIDSARTESRYWPVKMAKRNSR